MRKQSKFWLIALGFLWLFAVLAPSDAQAQLLNLFGSSSSGSSGSSSAGSASSPPPGCTQYDQDVATARAAYSQQLFQDAHNTGALFPVQSAASQCVQQLMQLLSQLPTLANPYALGMAIINSIISTVLTSVVNQACSAVMGEITSIKNTIMNLAQICIPLPSFGLNLNLPQISAPQCSGGIQVSLLDSVLNAPPPLSSSSGAGGTDGGNLLGLSPGGNNFGATSFDPSQVGGAYQSGSSGLDTDQANAAVGGELVYDQNGNVVGTTHSSQTSSGDDPNSVIGVVQNPETDGNGNVIRDSLGNPVYQYPPNTPVQIYDSSTGLTVQGYITDNGNPNNVANGVVELNPAAAVALGEALTTDPVTGKPVTATSTSQPLLNATNGGTISYTILPKQ